MSNIRILPEHVANQIAAGEVIERPASVVRELMDNSIDAGADRINIRIEDGGKRLIRISDNGIGMDRDDLLLSLERHSTSKISAMSDIFSIRTLGFRGEALPSICSISRMEILSRPADQIIGHRLSASGGKLHSIDETGSAVGTSITIRDIFFNTPARLKFLKGEKTETGYIVDAVSRIALPFNHIHFKVNDGDKNILNIPASDNEINRFAALLGRSAASSLIDATGDANGCRINIYMASPENSRNKGDRIFIYINNRSIRDRLVIRSVLDGYGQRLMKGRYPQAFVFLEIDPSLVDVNVHPAKQEVRFQQSPLIYQAISSIIDRAQKSRFTPFFETAFGEEKTHRKTYAPETSISEPSWIYSAPEKVESVVPMETGSSRTEQTVRPPSYKDMKPLLQETLIKEPPRLIGQLRDTYLLFQAEDGLLIVDQHAAHERILYEKLKKGHREMKVDIQPFLIPVKIEASLKDGRVLEENMDQLAQLGFELDHFGGSTFLLRSAPAALGNAQWETLISDLIPALQNNSPSSIEQTMDDILIVMACHGAVRARQSLSQREITLLLEELDNLDVPTNCPHGRPIFKKIIYPEIEKMFKRIV
jgi:DNA mismatch repair protein MutL